MDQIDVINWFSWERYFLVTSIDTSQMDNGEIITFYSYKGGTGRTMALSNVACILAEQRSEGKGVLMIDWDLEAPGLHRFFFQDKFFPQHVGVVGDSFPEVDERPGLIDLFIELNSLIKRSEFGDDERTANNALNEVNLEDFIVPTHIPNLSILKAGRDNKEYSNKVNSFDWEGLYYRSPPVIRLLAERLVEHYRYVLIDSRTGYTDVSGICTMLMPQKLVVVFTPNRQSYTGIQELVRRATRYRRKSNDLRPLLVYPLPSRIEPSRDDLRAYWRSNMDQGIIGYQPMFEELFKEVYGLDTCNLNEYFEEVQIQHSANYAYGEEIAVLEEKTKDSFSLSRNYEVFSEWLVNSVAPWQRLYAKSPKPPSAIRVVLLSANPTGTSQVKLNEEYSQIYERIRLSEFRNQYDLIPERAISIKDLRKVLIEHEPDIVHFSGQGSKESGLVFQNESLQSETVSSKALTNLFKTSGKSVRCVFLSSCYSEKQAKAITKDVDSVVGTYGTISDSAAADFSTSFYLALGYGKSVNDAFDLGLNQMKLLNIPEEQLPKLMIREDADPSRLILMRGKITDIYPQESRPIDVKKELPTINSAIAQIKEKYDRLVNHEASVEDFWSVISPLMSKLTTERDIIQAIGIQNAQSLQLLRINLATSISEYRKSDDLGIEAQRDEYLKRIMEISTQVVNALNKIE